MDDQIFISNLELLAHIGVTDEERAEPQRLTVSLALVPSRGFSGLGDRLKNAVDYADVCERVRALAAKQPRNLIETLAEEIARALLAYFSLGIVEIELRKYILPETEFVAVRIRREAV
jgi:dihydroneopterin aldolase